MSKKVLRVKTFFHEIGRKVTSKLDYFIWKNFDPERRDKIDTSKINKILVVLINQEKGNVGGDFLTLGVLNAFKKKYPRVEVNVLTDKKTMHQFGATKRLKFIAYSDKKKSLSKLKKMNFNAVIMLTPGGLLPRDFSFIQYRVGYAHLGISGFLGRKKLGYTHKVRNHINNHMVNLRFQIFEVLGFKFNKRKPFLEFNTSDERAAKSFLGKHKAKKFIMLHPGGKYVAEYYKKGQWPPHLWELKKYASVADHFAKKGYKIIITGSEEEDILAKEIKRNSKEKSKIISACGKLSINQTGALLKMAKVLVATDTSIVHIAYQVDLPIVELMGPSIPEVVGAWPLNSNKNVILIDKGPCHRSMRKLPFPNGVKCLSNINADDVIKATNKLLNEFS